MALKTASEEMQEKIFANMSARAADMIRDDLDAMGPVRLSEVEAMQQSIVKIAMKLEEEELVILRRAAQFHDIGKLVIDLSCIQKPGKLNDEEWALIRKHPSIGANIIQPLGFMDTEQFIIRHHHGWKGISGWVERRRS